MNRAAASAAGIGCVLLLAAKHPGEPQVDDERRDAEQDDHRRGHDEQDLAASDGGPCESLLVLHRLR